MRKEFRPSDTITLRDRWQSYVSEHRLKKSKKRDAIVEQFFQTLSHISIDDLRGAACARRPGISRTTVYRTLKLLVNSGVAVEHRFGDGEAFYELIGKHHDHLICMKCSFILEFEDAEVERLKERVAHRLGGFTILQQRHEFYGLCPKYAGVSNGVCPNEPDKNT